MRRTSTKTLAVLAMLLAMAGCVCAGDMEAAQSRALKGFNDRVLPMAPCTWPRANCNTTNPDCETVLSLSRQNCGRCGRSCPSFFPFNFCYDGYCLPDYCTTALLGSNCPADIACTLGVCATGSIPCGIVKSDATGRTGTFTYAVNARSCTPRGNAISSAEWVYFQFNAFTVPVQFTLKDATGAVIFGPVVAGSGFENCANSLHCPGNPYGAACPLPPQPLYPNIPVGGSAFAPVLRPAGDTRVIVEVKVLCSSSKWEFKVGCVNTSDGCVRR